MDRCKSSGGIEIIVQTKKSEVCNSWFNEIKKKGSLCNEKIGWSWVRLVIPVAASEAALVM
jgi:hypothetical protein